MVHDGGNSALLFRSAEWLVKLLRYIQAGGENPTSIPHTLLFTFPQREAAERWLAIDPFPAGERTFFDLAEHIDELTNRLHREIESEVAWSERKTQ